MAQFSALNCLSQFPAVIWLGHVKGACSLENDVEGTGRAWLCQIYSRQPTDQAPSPILVVLGLTARSLPAGQISLSELLLKVKKHWTSRSFFVCIIEILKQELERKRRVMESLEIRFSVLFRFEMGWCSASHNLFWPLPVYKQAALSSVLFWLVVLITWDYPLTPHSKPELCSFASSA